MDAIRRRFKKEAKPAYLDEAEFKTNLGTGNFIFAGSSNDLFAAEHPKDWITRTLDYCNQFDNRYLFQTKNPSRVIDFLPHPVLIEKSVLCTTIETNRWLPDIMCRCPNVYDRMGSMNVLSDFVDTYVTIEPIMDFEPYMLIDLVKQCKPKQVNIGADSGRNNLPEPSTYKVNELIMELSSFTNVVIKPNLNRLLKNE
jgi:DNA repair photolyase